MHRIDTPTAQKDKFGVGKNGFTRGNPQTGTPATDLDDDYFDMLQEELAGIVEAAGITLDKTKRNQLRTALPLVLGIKAAALRDVGEGSNQIPDMSSFIASFGNNGYQKLPGGLILQWGQNSMPAPGASNNVTFPIAFPSTAYAVVITTNASGGATTGIAPSSTTAVTRTGFQWVRFAGSEYTSYGTGYWFAIGR
ncbi:gp53-like domain-containing protein [Leclercia adecarboxylata]|uniref:gp53-like domain-containing protein n=1 Tax=Leclercia adecarboxylata TaxID=83655 RepID=UPI00159BEB8D|nr:hypothetical protein [Leclercia adecarboxylata]